MNNYDQLQVLSLAGRMLSADELTSIGAAQNVPEPIYAELHIAYSFK